MNTLTQPQGYPWSKRHMFSFNNLQRITFTKASLYDTCKFCIGCRRILVSTYLLPVDCPKQNRNLVIALSVNILTNLTQGSILLLALQSLWNPDTTGRWSLISIDITWLANKHGLDIKILSNRSVTGWPSLHKNSEKKWIRCNQIHKPKRANCVFIKISI